MLFKIYSQIFLLLLLNLSKSCSFGLVHLALNETQFRNALEVVNPGDTIQLGLQDFLGDWFGPFEITRNGTAEDPITLDIVGNIIFRSDPDDNDSAETLFTIRASHWRIGGHRFYIITDSQPALKFQDAHHNFFSRIDLIVTIIEDQIGFSMDNSHLNTIDALIIDKSGDGIGLNLEKCFENSFNFIRFPLGQWDTYGRVQIRNSDQNFIQYSEAFSLELTSSSENLIENCNLVSLTIDSENDSISTKNIIRNNIFNYDWTGGEVEIPKFAIYLKNTSCCGTIEGNFFSGVSSAFPLKSFISIEGNNYELNQNEGGTLEGFGFFLGDSVDLAIFGNNSITVSNPEKFCIHGNPQVHSTSICIQPDNSCQFAQLSNFESGDCPYEETTTIKFNTTTEPEPEITTYSATEITTSTTITTQSTTKVIDTTTTQIHTTTNSGPANYFISSFYSVILMQILVVFVKILF